MNLAMWRIFDLNIIASIICWLTTSTKLNLKHLKNKKAMGLSDCIKCCDTPCTCGWDYKEWDSKKLSKHIADITQYRTKEEAEFIISWAASYVRNHKNWTDKPKE